jgi:hypothetical protein
LLRRWRLSKYRSSLFPKKGLAGDAVHIEPVSAEIPCKQGILQGRSRFQAPSDKSQSKKPLRRRDFLGNSLNKLSGKFFRPTGNSKRITGNFATIWKRLFLHGGERRQAPYPRPLLP